jgi:hypothetical protein
MYTKSLFAFSLVLFSFASMAQPVALHPDNPHYFLYKGEPRIFVSSAEHYGALLNLDFDYLKYLETLHEEGMDYTRIFTGAYVENVESFGIEKNTLAPLENRLITPWARSNESGYINGGNKFDLSKWDKDYFDRLNDFVQTADRYGIVVEITMFSSIYNEVNWLYSPLHPNNNINNTDHIERSFVTTLSNGNIFSYQEAIVRKIVREVNTYDNVIFEIQNEPWADQPGHEIPLNNTVYPKDGVKWFSKSTMASEASLEWQKAIAGIIRDEEDKLEKRHLIAQNYCNYSQSLPVVDDNIDILNFHYVWPTAVHFNYGYNKPLSFDESGFSGKEISTYRRQAWRFILAGGAVFNNLDYSFVAGHENGTFEENHSPGFGSREFRKQLVILKDFINSSDFVNMRPVNHIVYHAPGFQYQVIGKKGREYLMYLEGAGQRKITLDLPDGRYDIMWIEPATGKEIKSLIAKAKNNSILIETPPIEIDMALKIRLKE